VFAQGPGNALKLDGYDDYVECSTNNRGIHDLVTVEAWVKTSSTKLQMVLTKYDHANEHGYQLVMRYGKAAFSGRDGSGTYRISGYSPGVFNDNKWHHLAGVTKNGTWSIYVDGVLESQSVTGYTKTDLRSNTPLTLGNYYNVNNDFFDGQVDEIRIWKRALTEAEIRQNMCQKVDPADKDLVAYYKFDEGSGSTVRDLSSYGIHGTFKNMDASRVWVLSGAPIGDVSTYLYPATSGQPHTLNLQTSGNDKVSVTFNAAAPIKGTHIYTVASPPNTMAGINNPGQVAEYFGTFKVGAANAEYTVRAEREQAGCFRTLHQRTNNTATIWTKIAQVSPPEFPTYNTFSNQNEFVFTTSTKATIQGSSSFCTGQGTTLSVDTPGTVRWSNGQTGNSIQVSTPGEFTATINENGCEYTGKFTVTEVPLPVVNLGDDLTLCFGEVVELQAALGAYTYRWSTGATTSSIKAMTAGTYWVEVANSNGCITRDEITIATKPDPKITLPHEVSACYGEMITLNASSVSGASYRWSTGQTTPTITTMVPAELSVTITVDGCDYVHQVNVSADECPAIPNIITPNGDGKNDTFILKGINTDAIDVEIFNRWGKSIYKSKGYKNDWAPANDGIYYYHIRSHQTQKDYKGWLEVLK